MPENCQSFTTNPIDPPERLAALMSGRSQMKLAFIVCRSDRLEQIVGLRLIGAIRPRAVRACWSRAAVLPTVDSPIVSLKPNDTPFEKRRWNETEASDASPSHGPPTR